MNKSRVWAFVVLVGGLALVVVGLDPFGTEPAPPRQGYIDAVVVSHAPAGHTATLRVSDGRPVETTCTVRPEDFASGRLPAPGTVLSVDRVGDRCHPRVHRYRDVSGAAIFWGSVIAVGAGFALWNSFAADKTPAAPSSKPGGTRKPTAARNRRRS